MEHLTNYEIKHERIAFKEKLEKSVFKRTLTLQHKINDDAEFPSEGI